VNPAELTQIKDERGLYDLVRSTLIRECMGKVDPTKLEPLDYKVNLAKLAEENKK
jgi:hypothetical protein